MKTAHAKHCIVSLLLATVLIPASARALTPTPWQEEGIDFRLLLGSLDGDENAALLRHDGHRYTVGFGGSSPLYGKDWLEANLEAWVTERGYGGAVTAGGEAVDDLTLQAVALAYGLRFRGSSRLRPYGMIAGGFQASRLQGELRGSTPAEDVREDNLEPTLHVGLGLEWQIGRDLFAIDWRRWYTRGDFSRYTAEELDLGGEFLGISLGRRW